MVKHPSKRHQQQLFAFYVFSYFLVYSDGAPLSAAHRAVIGRRQFDYVDIFTGLVVHTLGGFEVEGFCKMGLPVEIAPGDTDFAVAVGSAF